MAERVLVTVHNAEISEEAFHALLFVCSQITGDDTQTVHSRSVGDPSDGPTSLEFYVRSGRDV